MTRRKALIIALSVAGISGLIFVLLLISKPVPAISHASYTWKPGCHCGKPTTTTAKPTTTTARPTTTTARPTPTTARPTTTTAKASTTTAATQASTTTASTTTSSANTTEQAGTTITDGPTTTASDDGGDSTDALALGAAAAGGDGSSGDGGSGPAGGEAVAAETSGPPHYYFSPVAIGLLAVYGVSFGLYRTRRVKVATHRKIWNMLLLGTFLLCGVIGLLLAVGITRSTPWELPTWLLVWHVETGIAMCFISFFHIGWHARYYLAVVTGRRRAARPERAPEPEPERRRASQRASAFRRSASRDRARNSRTVRPATLRTTEDRMLAFQKRQADRAAHAATAEPGRSGADNERWGEERGRVAPAS